MITVDDLTIAIENSIDSDMKLEHEEAFDLAQHVLNFFGYSNRIIDNVLEPEDRDTFYMLEDATILTTEREETTLYDGREWRIHYWLFRKDRIRQLMSDVDDTKTSDSEDSFYKELGDDIWDRGDEN